MDKQRKEIVALKVEKADKPKKVLLFEYQVLKQLQGLPHICPVYEFIESYQPQGLNFIVMKMLSKNLATVKRHKGKHFTPVFALRLLVCLFPPFFRLVLLVPDPASRVKHAIANKNFRFKCWMQ